MASRTTPEAVRDAVVAFYLAQEPDRHGFLRGAEYADLARLLHVSESTIRKVIDDAGGRIAGIAIHRGTPGRTRAECYPTLVHMRSLVLQQARMLQLGITAVPATQVGEVP